MKKNFLYTLVCAASVAFSMVASAQDAHFSQYFASPLYTNPAMTGQINGNVRLNSLFRTQWAPFQGAYTTGSFSADARFNNFGAGLAVIDQVSGPNDFNRLSINLSGAYDIAFRSNTNQHLVVGIQAGIYNLSYGNKNVTVGDQYVDGFGAINAVNEDFNNLSVLSPDLNFGVLWFNGSTRQRWAPFAGAAVFHLLQPYDSFDKSSRIPMRYLVHAGVRYRTNSAIDIIPNFKASMQGVGLAYNGIVGCNINYQLIDTYTSLEAGLGYRLDDAVVPYLGLSYKDFSFGVSYDANISTLSDVGNNKSALEFSVTYISRRNSVKKQFICPRL
ncbi:MAG TPA: PorP/SprF family type IX secretion system membrane protein [Luteibaculaceae bacterium]|nr:PorP/SprF family type IX secretion system membrane protein [Luteibaculaceae bacterium]